MNCLPVRFHDSQFSAHTNKEIFEALGYGSEIFQNHDFEIFMI